MNIRHLISGNWPTTEGVLFAAGEEVNYGAQKSHALLRATTDLYADAPPPAEDAIPAVAAYWIADQATLYLIPVAKDYYAVKHRRAEGADGANITYYDLIAPLDALAETLARRVADNLSAALAALQVRRRPAGETPVVSTTGLLVDPVANARRRG